jgi:hypothetical protein
MPPENRTVWFEALATYASTFVVLSLAWLLRSVLGLEEAELLVGFVMFQAAHFINDPHFSVTYLLFYRDARERLFGRAFGTAQRARYALAGVLVPCGLVTWAAAALLMRSAQALGNLAQLMLLLVGFHYAKQGFGMLTVLSARRGVRFSARERSLLLVHCYAAWAYAWAQPARTGRKVEEKGVVYWAPPHPEWLEHLTLAALVVSSLALAASLFAKWRSERRLPTSPLMGFLVTIWLWTIYTSLDPLLRYVIPALHSLQYLYFVWLLRRNEAREQEGPPVFGPPVATRLWALALSALVLGWVLFRGAPELLDTSLTGIASASMGETPFFAALFVVVNIHHYFMDAVIWRRENPELRLLYADP